MPTRFSEWARMGATTSVVSNHVRLVHDIILFPCKINCLILLYNHIFYQLFFQICANMVLGSLLKAVRQKFHLPLNQSWMYDSGSYYLLHLKILLYSNHWVISNGYLMLSIPLILFYFLHIKYNFICLSSPVPDWGGRREYLKIPIKLQPNIRWLHEPSIQNQKKLVWTR